MIRRSIDVSFYYATRYRAVSRLKRWCKTHRALVVTFDDGPGTELTQSLIQLLAEHRVKATFFLLGRRAERAPQIVDALKIAGHDLGTHSYNHCHAWKTEPLSAIQDIDNGYSALARWLPSNALFRPPHGKLTYSTWRAVSSRRAPICWWTVDSGDTQPHLPSAEACAEKLARAGGGVLLMHDFDRGKERADFVLRTTNAVLLTAKREGLNVVTMTELLAKQS